MKHKRLFVLAVLMLFISISIFTIYNNTYKEEINYVVLGDSIAAGRNPYGVDDYGYADYIRDYLNSKDKLNSYVNYAVSGYLTSNVINDINYNKTIEVDNDIINLKEALRESDLVTISIGANDLLNGMSLSSIPSTFEDRAAVTEKIDNTINQVDNLLDIVQGYAKGDIIVVGYYNPFPSLTKYKEQIDEVVDYVDQEYEKLCNSKGIYYVKISDVIDSSSDYLPNPLDIHPSIQGYEAISREIIRTLDKEVLK